MHAKNLTECHRYVWGTRDSLRLLLLWKMNLSFYHDIISSRLLSYGLLLEGVAKVMVLVLPLDKRNTVLDIFKGCKPHNHPVSHMVWHCSVDFLRFTKKIFLLVPDCKYIIIIINCDLIKTNASARSNALLLIIFFYCLQRYYQCRVETGWDRHRDVESSTINERIMPSSGWSPVEDDDDEDCSTN